MYQCNIKEGDEENWIPLRCDSNDARQTTILELKRIKKTNFRFALFSIRFNKDGTELVAGSTDQNLYIYNREINSCVLTLRVHDDDVNAVCFGNDGSNILLSGADDGLVKVWDRRTMSGFGRAQAVGAFAGHRDGITFIDSRGDDKYFLSNSKDQTIKVWDIRHFATQAGIVSDFRILMLIWYLKTVENIIILYYDLKLTLLEVNTRICPKTTMGLQMGMLTY